MTNKKISNFEFSTLNYFITRAFLIGVTFNAIISAVKQDCWIIPIISIIPAIFLIYFVNYIMNFEPSLDLSKKITKLFNKKFGIIIIIIIILMFFIMGILNYLNLNNFVQSQFLNKTPMLAISIMFAITTYYILSKGINVVCRTSTILFYISIILFILSFIGLIPEIKISNLKPFFIQNTNNYIKGLNSYYSFNVIPMFLLMIIPKNKIDNPKIKKTLIISYILSALTLFIIVFLTIAVFGYELCQIYEYPEFLVLKHVTLVGLTSRIESILIMHLIFDIIILNIFIIYFISNSIKSTFNIKNNNIIYLIICILMVIGTVYTSKYNIFIDKFIKNIIPSIITIITTLIILLIYIKIKMSQK